MKILVIGNSFGGDCTHYLYGVARSDGMRDFKVVNLYIGGCSLYRHYRNMLSEAPVYSFELNGQTSGLYVSLKDALLSDEWDVVFTQQCSPESGEAANYEPYATALADYVRRMAPGAAFYVHQTWTFERGAARFRLTSYTEPEEMFAAIVRNYDAMAQATHARGIIPDGEAMFTLWQRRERYGLEKVHRDTFHADYGVGRYLLALTVYSTLTGRDISGNMFSDFDVPVSEAAAAAAREVAAEVTAKYRIINEKYAASAR